MSRFLEAVFVLAWSLVGFAMSVGEGNALHRVGIECGVQAGSIARTVFLSIPLLKQ